MVAIAFAVAILVGYLNGLITVKTRLPSFIVTLASLFILRGLSLVGLKWATGGSTQMRGIREAVAMDPLMPFLSGDAFPGLFRWLAGIGLIDTFPNGAPKVTGIPVEILWFLVLTVAATWVLLRTPVGNWIFALGGEARAARTTGVPVATVKTVLFMVTACSAALVAIITVLTVGTADTLRGNQKEFEAIIAAVIGGVLLTGGYGTVYGVLFGALIFGLVQMGIFYTGIDTDWFKVFLGIVILMAVLVNNYFRLKALGRGGGK